MDEATQHLSPDRRWWWDGVDWRQLSDDGEWWWDGSHWHGMPNLVSSVVPTAKVHSPAPGQTKSRKDKLREAALARLVNGELLSGVDARRVRKELELARMADSAQWAGMTPGQRLQWLSAQAANLPEPRNVQPPKDRLKPHYSSDGLQLHLIEELPRGLTQALADQLGPSEIVRVALRGLNREALACTDKRVIILKTGFFTGQFFGRNTYQLPYPNIAGAEVRAHLVTAYFQLNAGGMNSTDLSVWNMRWGRNGRPPRRLDPARAPNAISLSRRQVPRFQEASAFIMSRVAEAHRPTEASSEAALMANRRPEVLDALARLGQLKDAGVLTQHEFDSKKTELLRRL
jgi:hypothetical protein